MFQDLDLKKIDEGCLVLIFNLYFLVLEYEFYLDRKGREVHSFVLLNSDKVVSWYTTHNLKDIINVSGGYNVQKKSREIKKNKMSVM